MPTFLRDQWFDETEHRLLSGLRTTHVVMKRLQSNSVRPVSVKRRRPVDLFASGTARNTSSLISYGSGVDHGYAASASQKSRFINSPSNHFWANSDLSFPGPAIDMPDLEKIYNKIRGDMRGNAVNLAMAMAEFRQTAKLFVSAARVVSTRGRSLAAAVKADRGVAKAWLGFQYGVKPLVGDVLQSIEDLKAACQQPVYMGGVESRTVTGMKRTEATHRSTYYAVPAVGETHQSYRQRVQWRAVYNANPVFNTFVAHGFTNPFALAYELIPFSFVFDWWINVGDVLSTLDNMLLFDKLVVINSSRDVTARYVTSPGFTRNVDNYCSAHNWTRILRTDRRSAPMQISMIASLAYKPSVSMTHISNGLALLRATRGRFR